MPPPYDHGLAVHDQVIAAPAGPAASGVVRATDNPLGGPVPED
ncbi:hypothetical protein AB0D27_26625 [Streptomyces sp. NPDC048415]